MPWFYVDDGFSDSKPVLNMPDRHRLAACGLWVLAGSWSAKEELDGFVPNSKLRQLRATPPVLAALTDSGPMFSPLCEKLPTGIVFNSWEKWQKTRAELLEKRREDAERQRKWRAENPDAKQSRKVKGRNAAASSNPDLSQRDTTVTTGVTDSVTDANLEDVSRCDASRARARGPDPTRPDPLSTSSTHLSTKAELSGGSGGRGSRLPNDWMPPQAVVAQMRSDHPHVDLKAEHAKFVDYWRGKAGKDARKADWAATWRNWIRRAAEQQQPRPAANGKPHKLRVIAELAAKARADETVAANEITNQPRRELQ